MYDDTDEVGKKWERPEELFCYDRTGSSRSSCCSAVIQTYCYRTFVFVLSKSTCQEYNKQPPMSKLYRNAAIAAAAVGAGIFLIPSSKKSVPYDRQDIDPPLLSFANQTNSLETFGTQNIANAYSRGGGSDTHLPGIATTRGMAGQWCLGSRQTD